LEHTVIDMRKSSRLPILSVGLALLTAACGSQSSVDDALRRDLEAASAGSIELAPKGSQQTVSATELVPLSKPVVSNTRRAEAPAPRPKPRTPQVAPATEEPSAPRPVSTPRVSPPPPGGYKTVGEVIRNAPFPIKP
jgi:hypothetical protein